jgi:ABC-type transporter Mla subunit MlaD
MSEALKFKVGLLVVGSTVLLILTIIWLGTSELWEEKIPCVTFMDESIVGLDQGSSVRFRGILIGHITRVVVAPDQKNIALYFDVHVKNLDAGTIHTLKNLDKQDWTKNGLRMRNAQQGLTGVKYLEADFVDPEKFKAQQLSFKPPSNYIPSAKSVFSNIEETAMEIVGSVKRILASIEKADVQKLAENLNALISTANGMVQDIRDRMPLISQTLESAKKTLDTVQAEVGPLSASAKNTMHNVDNLTLTAEKTIREMDLPATTEKARVTLGKVSEATEKIGAAADSIAGTFQDFRGDLRVPLLELERTLQSIRTFVDYLERNPAALIHGRTGKKDE